MTVRVVGIGGSLRPGSQSELALKVALSGAREAGATVTALTGADLVLPFYDPSESERPEAAKRLVDLLREADGVVLVSPGYHGSLSGLVKNALDYVEDLRTDVRPYLDGRAVGCATTAAGWQASVTTLSALRAIVHALRGWPTPLGSAINTVQVRFDAEGGCSEEQVAESLRTIGRQVVEFATR
ncbi:NAD(P)H-dependent oxidoreductase [Kutzneria viridogrisea]|uniref:NADPH-dependent FMN reductase n=2 Tax=Kutzneria TaxID=43356 RepID=W5VXS4_9PSEU|nr:NAD(P)H-dependent oxidoreductase [Kutzneria albida]AHH93653.1 NADPH-dependent FMN reductase [Kutzneria albida DSM 43870]MBA8928963.1 FMN reductase [Kutzneria viridogrisea]MBA8931343.1 FMN reductase [Kutzneria viridogrisea]